MRDTIKRELITIIAYNIIAILVSAVISNSGIDKYLADKILDTIGEAWWILLSWTGTYFAVRYICRKVYLDLLEIKKKLPEKKEEGGEKA